MEEFKNKITGRKQRKKGVLVTPTYHQHSSAKKLMIIERKYDVKKGLE